MPILSSKLQRSSSMASEILPIVDQDGHTIGSAERAQLHRSPGVLHPVVHLHVISSRGEVFLQKRSQDKDTFPGYWDTAVGGHLSYGESVDEGLRREAAEEIGLMEFEALSLGTRRVNTPVESELVYSFVTRSDGPFRLDHSEIADGRFWRVSEIEAALGSFTPNFEQDWPALRDWLSAQAKTN